MKYIKIFFILLILMFSVNIVSATTLNITTLSNNVTYSNVTEYSTDSTGVPILLSTNIITDNIIGRQNLSVEFHRSGTKTALISVRKNGVEIASSSTTSLTYTLFQFNTTDFTWQVGDIYEVWGYVGSGCCAGDSVYIRNLNMSYDISSFPLQLLSPANGSNVISPFNITWKEAPLNFSYTYQVSTDSSFINIVTSGTVSSTLTQNISVPLTLNSGTYYWRVANTSGNYSNWFNFTVAPVSSLPGTLNVTVFDETNTSYRLSNFTAELYNGGGGLLSVYKTNSTTSGWANFTFAQHGIVQTEYLLRVIPTGLNSSYKERSQIVTPNATVIFYSPNSSSENVTQNILVLNDITTLFPFADTKISIFKNNSLMYSNYFDVAASVSVWLIYGQQYSIQLESGNNILNYGYFVSTYSGTQTLIVSDFSINTSIQQPFVYNITHTTSDITLNWNLSGGTLTSLNFNIYKGNNTNLVYNLSTLVEHGQAIYVVTNTSDIYYITFEACYSGSTTCATTSFVIDYRAGTRPSSNTTTGTWNGLPIGMGLSMCNSNYCLPQSWLNWFSVIIVLLIILGTGAIHSGIGNIAALTVLLGFEYYGWFVPSSTNDANNYLTMGITGGLLLLSILLKMVRR